jgi:hypothetical protein
MSSESAGGPTWIGVIIKFVFGVAWVGAAGVAAGVLMSESSKAADVAAALTLIVPPIAWCIIGIVWAKRQDEMHQRVAALGQANGLRFAIMWVGMMLGGSVLSSLFLGDGEVNVSGLMQSAVTYIAIQPALAYIFGEATAFGQLRGYAKRG